MNDFAKCLERSHAASDLPFWEGCYRQAFPTMITMADHRKDGAHQRAGVDRTVILDNGKPIWVDEKVRGRNAHTGIVYEDIALEEYSVLHQGLPGWVIKPLLCDYIAYAIAPLGKCYLLPVPQLQAAWKKHATEWKSKYPKILAQNNGYKTLSWGIPVDVLFRAIGQCLRASFQPQDITE